LVSWPISSLARIIAWTALTRSHQTNLWLFGCLYYISLTSLGVCFCLVCVDTYTSSLVRLPSGPMALASSLSAPLAPQMPPLLVQPDTSPLASYRNPAVPDICFATKPCLTRIGSIWCENVSYLPRIVIGVQNKRGVMMPLISSVGKKHGWILLLEAVVG
jgi:hypothetical protein